jgi:hypothetical protein
MAITESDIIRLLSDPRFERTVLAILRRRLRVDEVAEKHVSESDREMPEDWGWIPIAQAAVKYQLSPGDIDVAIQKRHVKGNSRKVDEDSLRVWAFDGRTRGLPKPETHLAEDLESDRLAVAKHGTEAESYSMADAAELLQVTEERLVEHLLSGTLQQVGTDRVSKASVRKHRDHLMRLLGTSAAPVQETAAAPTGGNLIVSTREAARVLGIRPVSVSALVCNGKLEKAGYGHVTHESLTKYLETRGASRKATEPPTAAGPAPASAPAAEEPWMTTAAAAEALGVPMPTASSYASKGLLTKAGWGKVTVASVEALRAKRTQHA